MKIVQRGFTILELMLILAIISLFVQLATPSYQKWIEKTHNQSRMSWLIQAEMQIEICYLNNNSYLSCLSSLPNIPASAGSFSFQSETDQYALSLRAPSSDISCYHWSTDQTHQWKIYTASQEDISSACL